jgi:hypothetical protein
MNHLRWLAAALLMAISQSSLSQTTIPENARYCNISQPPSDAGELDIHGTMAKVYPRTRNMPLNYTGCQTMWAQEENWFKANVVYFRDGKPTLFWHGYRGNLRSLCRHDGALLSGTGDCSPVDKEQSSPRGMPSFPPGCIAQFYKVGDLTERCKNEYDPHE